MAGSDKQSPESKPGSADAQVSASTANISAQEIAPGADTPVVGPAGQTRSMLPPPTRPADSQVSASGTAETGAARQHRLHTSQQWHVQTILWQNGADACALAESQGEKVLLPTSRQQATNPPGIIARLLACDDQQTATGIACTRFCS